MYGTIDKDGGKYRLIDDINGYPDKFSLWKKNENGQSLGIM